MKFIEISPGGFAYSGARIWRFKAGLSTGSHWFIHGRGKGEHSYMPPMLSLGRLKIELHSSVEEARLQAGLER